MDNVLTPSEDSAWSKICCCYKIQTNPILCLFVSFWIACCLIGITELTHRSQIFRKKCNCHSDFKGVGLCCRLIAQSETTTIRKRNLENTFSPENQNRNLDAVLLKYYSPSQTRNVVYEVIALSLEGNYSHPGLLPRQQLTPCPTDKKMVPEGTRYECGTPALTHLFR